jgi:hypothetical protein
MATHTSALALYKAQKARFDGTMLTARQMHAEIAKQGFKDSKDLTRGGVGPNGIGRKRWLREMGHPRGRGFVVQGKQRNRIRPLPVGMITGDLYNSMRLTSRISPKGQEFGIRNTAPYAKYILRDVGTRKMVGPGFQKEVQKRWRARNRALMEVVRARQRKAI